MLKKIVYLGGNMIQLEFNTSSMWPSIATLILTIDEFRTIINVVGEQLDEERWNSVLINPMLSDIGAP